MVFFFFSFRQLGKCASVDDYCSNGFVSVSGGLEKYVSIHTARDSLFFFFFGTRHAWEMRLYLPLLYWPHSFISAPCGLSGCVGVHHYCTCGFVSVLGGLGKCVNVDHYFPHGI